MAITIKRAVKYGAKCRLALYGPSGSGKTYTALALARSFSEKRICVIDTERGSASKYAGDPFDFDVIELESFHPNSYIEAIRAVVQAGDYDVLVIDSASHEWEGSRGALELAGRDFTNWANVTPLHNKFIDAMLTADIHVIATMRAKEEHVMEKEEGKKAIIRKMGMEPIQRKGMQYEFDIVGSLSMDNVLTIEKTRCSGLKDQVFAPGNERAMVGILATWLSGTPVPAKEPTYREVYEKGKAKGLWQNASGFFAFSSAEIGQNVTQENVKQLSVELLLQIDKAVEQEQAA